MDIYKVQLLRIISMTILAGIVFINDMYLSNILHISNALLLILILDALILFFTRKKVEPKYGCNYFLLYRISISFDIILSLIFIITKF